MDGPLAGLAVSVAGNVGHVAGHSLASRTAAGVPPLVPGSAEYKARHGG